MKYSLSSILLRLFLGILLIVLLITKLGLNNIIQSFKLFNFIYLLPIIFALIVYFVISGLNLMVLVAPLTQLQILKSIKIAVYIWGIRNFLPANLGDLSLLYFLNHENVKVGPGTAVFVIDKITTMIIGIIISVFSLLLFFKPEVVIRVTLFLVMATLLILTLIFSRQGRSLTKYFLGRYAERFAGFFDTIKTYLLNHKNIVFANLFINLTRWVLSSIPLYFAFIALKLSIPFWTLFLVNSAIIIISLVPVSISGLGIREDCY